MTETATVIDLTVDVCILMSGSGIGNPCHLAQCRDLMKMVQREHGWMVALDRKGRIRAQYERVLKEGRFGHEWLRYLADHDKVRIVDQLRLNKGIVTALIEAHFDSSAKEDFKYVETAAATACKILVSHDYDDYSERVCEILRNKLGVLVHDAPGCLSWAEGLAK